ncbi:unnamed protein product [Peronospora belbahrii]|uniref:TRAF-type domain-containing protein n=1 Tax=Peronospora belbahrii TaxID=622444 RepID=A0ABN8CS82_9STRA|nr:unnamed protein product [Peronospora belbahrii]
MIVLLSRARLGIGPHIGRELPICCPEHRTSVAVAKEERDLKLRFCTVVCSVDLEDYHSYRNSIKCDGHRRKPDVEKHNQQCHVKVESPCSRHPRELVCSNVTASARGIEIVAGRRSWLVCNKEAIAPHEYSECKRVLKCTCSEFDRYTKKLAPLCIEKVEFTPPCQHTISLSCHDRQDCASGMRKFVCKEKVRMSLPRCSHEMAASCSTAETLKKWSGESCATIGVVQEGNTCERAFELAQSPSRGQEQVVLTNPECGHEYSTTCFEGKRLQEKVAQWSKKMEDVDPLEIVQEGDASKYRNCELNIQCSREVVYIRACGHKANMKCSEARHITTFCDETVTVEHPICGHLSQLQCNLKKHVNAWQPWQDQTSSIKLLQEDSVVEDTLSCLGLFRVYYNSY